MSRGLIKEALRSIAKNKARFIFLALTVLIAIATIICGLNWSLIILSALVAYILVNLLAKFLKQA